ncbi:unnamed protein product [Arabis nemorensis]|uniref:Uncharacterized protein n=1 Tax=Arabis nemorensis TaxID=586526 RepID=A0A565B1U2_9BRAS|nr:unnamed protein product [Arabis nemorensis]
MRNPSPKVRLVFAFPSCDSTGGLNNTQQLLSFSDCLEAEYHDEHTDLPCRKSANPRRSNTELKRSKGSSDQDLGRVSSLRRS